MVENRLRAVSPGAYESARASGSEPTYPATDGATMSYASQQHKQTDRDAQTPTIPESLPADWADRTPDARHSYRFLHCEKADLTREIAAMVGFDPDSPARGLRKHEYRLLLDALAARGIAGADLGARATKVEIIAEIDARLELGASGDELTNIELALVARVLEGER